MEKLLSNVTIKKTIQQIFIIIILLLISNILKAQPHSTPMDPDLAPVDGGLSLLVAAGIGYSIKRMRRKK